MAFELTVVLEQASLKRGTEPVPKRSVLYFNTNYAKKKEFKPSVSSNYESPHLQLSPSHLLLPPSQIKIFFPVSYSQISSICDLHYGCDPQGQGHTRLHVTLHFLKCDQF